MFFSLDVFYIQMFWLQKTSSQMFNNFKSILRIKTSYESRHLENKTSSHYGGSSLALSRTTCHSFKMNWTSRLKTPISYFSTTLYQWSNSKDHPFSIGSNSTKLGILTIHILNHVKNYNTQTQRWKYTHITIFEMSVVILQQKQSIHLSWNVYSVFR